jgi:hypothetical protein
VLGQWSEWSAWIRFDRISWSNCWNDGGLARCCGVRYRAKRERCRINDYDNDLVDYDNDGCSYDDDFFDDNDGCSNYNDVNYDDSRPYFNYVDFDFDFDNGCADNDHGTAGWW